MNYSFLPFFICLCIFLVNIIVGAIFIYSSYAWLVLLLGAVSIALVIIVNEIAQNRHEERPKDN